MLTTILKELEAPGRSGSLAAACGFSASTMTRLESDHLKNVCALLAHMGLKLIPDEKVVVNADTYRALCHIASKAMSDPKIADSIVLED